MRGIWRNWGSHRGNAANHLWNPYECCKNDDCDPGYRCDNHACIAKKIAISLPNESFVGDTANITVTVDGVTAPFMAVQVTGPDGSTATSSTDSGGRAQLKPELQGPYRVDVVERGTTLRTASITVLPKPVAPVTPAPFAILEDPKVCSGLVVLILVAAAAIVYFRFVRKGASGPKTPYSRTPGG